MMQSPRLTPFALCIFLAACGADEPQSGKDVSGKAETKKATAAKDSSSNQTDTVWPQISLVEIAPGPASPVQEQSSKARKIAGDPEMVAAGGALYQAFNCVGCHFNGGGGIGPPLMDNQWIYGSSVEHIAATIREGRPNGMPSYREMVPEEQLWQLAAYVKSLSTYETKAEQ